MTVWKAAGETVGDRKEGERPANPSSGLVVSGSNQRETNIFTPELNYFLVLQAVCLYTALYCTVHCSR